jgi:ethanolamine ammonia-lyase small subunit
VRLPFDSIGLAREIEALGLTTLTVASEAADRATYLRRPDLGRRLAAESRRRLDEAPRASGAIQMVMADGLSSAAVHTHAVPVLAALASGLTGKGQLAAQVVLAHQARVALGDEIGERVGARLVIVLIGERPGLSSPDSLGAYLTFAPRVGRTDAERNCVSNIRPAGLGYEEAASRIAWLAREALRRRYSGVALKDESPPPAPLSAEADRPALK